MENEEQDNIQKVTPYQRLQAILSEGKSAKDLVLTDKATNNLDRLLGKSEPTLWEKVKSFFIKIDSKIFIKEKITNRFQKR